MELYLFCYCIHMKKVRKNWIEKNREKLNEQAKEYRKNNPEKIKEIKRRYYEKNKEKVLKRQREYMKKWRKKNPEKCRAYATKWRTKNAERLSLAREQKYLSSQSLQTCHDHLSSPEIRVLPMNVSSQSHTETFDFSIAWLRDLSQDAPTTNE